MLRVVMDILQVTIGAAMIAMLIGSLLHYVIGFEFSHRLLGRFTPPEWRVRSDGLGVRLADHVFRGMADRLLGSRPWRHNIAMCFAVLTSLVAASLHTSIASRWAAGEHSGSAAMGSLGVSNLFWFAATVMVLSMTLSAQLVLPLALARHCLPPPGIHARWRMRPAARRLARVVLFCVAVYAPSLWLAAATSQVAGSRSLASIVPIASDSAFIVCCPWTSEIGKIGLVAMTPLVFLSVAYAFAVGTSLADNLGRACARYLHGRGESEERRRAAIVTANAMAQNFFGAGMLLFVVMQFASALG